MQHDARRERLLASGILLAVLAIAYARAWRPGQTFLADVLFRFFLGQYHLFQQAIRSGSFPFWNPYISGGVPFLANAQSSLFYPGTYLFAWLHFSTALKCHVLLHFFLAGLGMFVLARHLKLPFIAALLSGLVYMMNGFAAFHYQLPGHLQAYALAPWTLFLFRNALKKESFWPRMAGGLAVGGLCVTGYIPFILYAFILLLILGWALAETDRPHRWRDGLLLLLFGVGLAAVQLGPTLHFALQSSRHAGLGNEWLLAKSLLWPEIGRMFFYPLWSWRLHFPVDLGVSGFYWGYPVLFLSVWGGWNYRRSAFTWALVGFIGLSLILSAGKSGGLYLFIAAHLRPFSWLRYPTNSLLWANFCMALLAGFGLSKVSRWSWLWVLLCTVDLSLFAQKAYETIPSAFYNEVPATARFLQQAGNQERLLMDPASTQHLTRSSDTRYAAYSNFADSLIPDYAAVFQLHDAGGGEEFEFERHRKVMDEIRKSPHTPWLDLLAVRHLLSFWGIPNMEKVWEGRSNIKIYDRPTALPRAYFVQNALFQDPDTSFTTLSRGIVNPRQTVLINSTLRLSPRIPLGHLFFSLPVEDLTPNRLRISVHTPQPGWVVLTDSFDSGWRVYSQGYRLPLFRANYLQQAVFVLAGQTELEWRYRPAFFTGCLILTGFAFAGLLLFSLVR